MISVCIPTYNGEKYIKAQLDSIIPQLSAVDEIIVSDDGSTDTTIEIVESYKDNRIKIYIHEKCSTFSKYPYYKISKNVENALVHATGDLIFLSDQDDIWMKNKVETVQQTMGENLVLLHDCIIIDENKNELCSSYFLQNKSKAGLISNLINSSYLGSCMAIKKEILKTALPFPAIPVPHDIWFGLIADWKGKIKINENKLVMYRRHGNNHSSSSGKSEFSLSFKIIYRINILIALISRLILKK